MHNNIIAIIPARGGSVGIPRKNIIDFCGKPLLAWSIEQALAVEKVSSVWVTSDSDEILATAMQYGARPIKRPAAISDGEASSESAWLHALNYIETQQETPVDVVLGLQATSPLRESQDIKRAVDIFEQNSLDSLFSAAELMDFLIWRKEGGVFKSLNYDYTARGRRQDRNPEYMENGSFYLFKSEIIRKYNNRLGGNIGISIMEFWKSFEIDDLHDLTLCRKLFSENLLFKEEMMG